MGLFRRIGPSWEKYWHFWLELGYFNPETLIAGDKTLTRGHSQGVIQKVSIPAEQG